MKPKGKEISLPFFNLTQAYNKTILIIDYLKKCVFSVYNVVKKKLNQYDYIFIVVLLVLCTDHTAIILLLILMSSGGRIIG